MSGPSTQLRGVVIATVLASLAACAPAASKSEAVPAAGQGGPSAQTATPAVAIPTASAIAINASLPRMLVHKSPTCGCCAAWVDHMRKAGFAVEVRDTDNLDPVKTGLGVPVGKGSCHTAEVGGYFIEGHVPADDIKRLLAAKPAAKGLVLPGMPMGSPGMEAPDGSVVPYTVELVAGDGSTIAFAQHPR